MWQRWMLAVSPLYDTLIQQIEGIEGMIGIRYLTRTDMDALGLRKLIEALTLHKTRKPDQPIHLVDAESEEVMELSPEALRLLHDILLDLMSGEVKTTIPHHAELNDAQAADILGVSRKYFIDLLQSGAMPYCRKKGIFYRVRMEDLMAYKEEIDRKRDVALDELVALSQELGLYD